MVYLTRREHFNSAHKLCNPDWTQAQNETVFGKCANEHWHGHNYYLHVTVKGKPDPHTGFIISIADLKGIIKEVVIDKVDHKNLNLDVAFMKGILPSTENFVMAIWRVLSPELARVEVQLHCIKLYETENIYASYYGE